MKITILGSGTGEPSLTRGSPGTLVSVRGRSMLIDSGAGTLRALLGQGVTYLDIDTIVYTHLHCDHVAELAPALFAMKNMSRPRRRDLTLIGPPGLSDFYRALCRLHAPTLDAEGYKVHLREIADGAVELPEGIVRALPVMHAGPSIGLRLEAGGKAFACSGDSGYCENLVTLGGGAELLMLECSFPDGMEVEGHLTPRIAGRVAVEARCTRLLLTHFYPVCDGFDTLGQCGAVFKGPILAACDGLTVTV